MNNKDLDRAIAQKIFKFQCFWERDGVRWYERHYEQGQWHYTTSLNDSFELVKKLEQQGFKMTFSSSYPENYTCIFEKSGIVYQGSDNHPAKAICMAAVEMLKA